MRIVQFFLGAAAFLWPKFSKSARETLVPYHMFLGRATFIAGLATMAVRSKFSNCTPQALGVFLAAQISTAAQMSMPCTCCPREHDGQLSRYLCN